MSFFSVDRFEEDYAVLIDENGSPLNVKKNVLPAEVREGSVLTVADGKYMLAPDEEKKRRKRIVSLQNKLFKR